ncbi:MAG: leucyl aminopeptidase [Gemmatimonadetes bacterium]|uniref:Probable cytosol aminopeptidase n=1 Tax=Candidatus Kutchimonas denitrificans TaxID=3056748 RepID=A0AAE4ZCH7_9BACT|nr:leucyl aminopeptidase [Gemmatimonadota bacterium]NIR75175.1 leucyl aminopeptidase [Candidatus Kutchimonas denitrificans]NIS00113.1 leucyl aminopeptidase [Gemmatimonadota bacterium]NIT65705.1 leucyl aminopeptidase [Gemmatimonadota bacterium]NIU52983.1 leucyl aminopeptidase [Gemmatimonadota bacterium]
MKLDIGVGTLAAADTPLLVLPWCQDSERQAERPTANMDPLDESLDLTLTQAVTSGDFRARRGQTLLLYRRGDRGPDRVLLIGVGERGDLNAERLREVGGAAAGRALELGITELTLSVSPSWLGGAVETEEAARALVEGVVLGHWRFEELRSEPGDEPRRRPLHSVTVRVPTAKSRDPAVRGAEYGQVVAEAQNYARELAIRPANIVNPRYLAGEARKLGEELGIEVKVLDREQIQEDGMGALLAVAAGSEEEPRFIVLEYCPEKGSRPLVLLGKGVTFDAGGLSIKTASGMETMKYDMSGAAAVLGAMRAIARLKLGANVIGLIPAVENLPSGHALRPGDVISSRSRKTIEVLNTDAEGRLILADALNYAARYEPDAMIDIATLTGACVVALGHHAIGLMGNDQPLIDEVLAAGGRSGERVWHLPLWEEYRKQLESEVADIKNTGGRAAGTITAGLFLREFVGSAPWAHLDIAGTAWAEKAGPYQPTGPTGVGVRLFTEWVRSRESD